MEKTELEVGDVVQINPEKKYGGALLVVTEPKAWGCQGYLYTTKPIYATCFQDLAYMRCTWEEIEYVGKIQWMQGEENENRKN